MLNEFVCRYVFVEVNAYILSAYVSFCMVLASMYSRIIYVSTGTGMCTGKSLDRKVDECICM